MLRSFGHSHRGNCPRDCSGSRLRSAHVEATVAVVGSVVPMPKHGDKLWQLRVGDWGGALMGRNGLEPPRPPRTQNVLSWLKPFTPSSAVPDWQASMLLGRKAPNMSRVSSTMMTSASFRTTECCLPVASSSPAPCSALFADPELGSNELLLWHHLSERPSGMVSGAALGCGRLVVRMVGLKALLLSRPCWRRRGRMMPHMLTSRQPPRLVLPPRPQP